MIFTIESVDQYKYPELIDEMFRMRAEVFSGRLGWDVSVENGREIDRFDAEDPLYLLSLNEQSGQLRGAVRLLPTTGPNMLRDVFFSAHARRRGREPFDLGELSLCGQPAHFRSERQGRSKSHGEPDHRRTPLRHGRNCPTGRHRAYRIGLRRQNGPHFQVDRLPLRAARNAGANRQDHDLCRPVRYEPRHAVPVGCRGQFPRTGSRQCSNAVAIRNQTYGKCRIIPMKTRSLATGVR
jgi:hypothetical protein